MSHLLSCLPLPAPGTLTVILALLAAVISMPPISERMKKPWLRAAAIFMFCLIAAAEIAIIQHADTMTTAERKQQNVDHLKELAKQEAQFRDQMAFLIGFKESVVGGLNEVSAKLKIAKAAAPNRKSVKVSVLELAKDILTFVRDKDQEMRNLFSINRGTEQETREQMEREFNETNAKIEKFQADNLVEYRVRFSGRVKNVTDDLIAQTDEKEKALFFQNKCLYAMNLYLAHDCAIGLSAMAEKLP